LNHQGQITTSGSGNITFTCAMKAKSHHLWLKKS